MLVANAVHIGIQLTIDESRRNPELEVLTMDFQASSLYIYHLKISHCKISNIDHNQIPDKYMFCDVYLILQAMMILCFKFFF